MLTPSLPPHYQNLAMLTRKIYLDSQTTKEFVEILLFEGT
jgi:hypothetical protein